MHKKQKPETTRPVNIRKGETLWELIGVRLSAASPGRDRSSKQGRTNLGVRGRFRGRRRGGEAVASLGPSLCTSY